MAEMEWIVTLLYELGILVEKHIVYGDNLGTTQLVVNPMYHTKIKHATLDFRFVHERIE